MHRNGVVRKNDINNKSDNTLDLKWIRIKNFVVRKGDEVEITPGFKVNKGEKLYVRQENMMKSFKFGERVDFDYKNYYSILYTSYLFIDELRKILPSRP